MKPILSWRLRSKSHSGNSAEVKTGQERPALVLAVEVLDQRDQIHILGVRHDGSLLMPNRPKPTELPDKNAIRKLFPKRVVKEADRVAHEHDADGEKSHKESVPKK